MSCANMMASAAGGAWTGYRDPVGCGILAHMLDRDEAIALVKRALAHVGSRSTDQAPDTMRAPISAYCDPGVWRDEMDTIFLRKPLALAVSVEIPHGGDYKAMEVVGIPVLIVRGEDGIARTFLNACRHRGAQLCEIGTGNRRRFRCPYHSWTYNDRGDLVAIFREDTFGDIDRSTHGLRELATAERAGIVYAVLTPDIPIDLDAWLGDFGPELDRLNLGQWHLYKQTVLPSPNWKLSYDGYLETYHLQTLHKRTFAVNSMTNLMVSDTFGPHQRVLFATKKLPALADLPETEWDVPAAVAPIYTIFPNVSVAGTWHNHALVSQLLPGSSWDVSETVQTVLTRYPVETDADRAMADGFTDLMLRGARDEDYVVAFAAQKSLTSGANTHLTFGRNELTLQHQHTWINRMMNRL